MVALLTVVGYSLVSIYFMNSKGFTSPFAKASSWNEGLRSYMLGIYNYMTIALMTSAVVAYFAARSGLTQKIFSSPLGIIVSLAPIFISMGLAVGFVKMSFQAVRGWFFFYAIAMGLSLSTVFLTFHMSEIFLAFASTASMFAGMSLYGYTTKTDLTSIGSVAFMAIWGLLIASLLNLFFKSGMLALIVSLVSVVVFAAMTAYDVQKLRRLYYAMESSSGVERSKLALFGALQLYMDFVAIFVNLLQLMRIFSSRD